MYSSRRFRSYSVSYARAEVGDVSSLLLKLVKKWAVCSVCGNLLEYVAGDGDGAVAQGWRALADLLGGYGATCATSPEQFAAEAAKPFCEIWLDHPALVPPHRHYTVVLIYVLML